MQTEVKRNKYIAIIVVVIILLQIILPIIPTEILAVEEGSNTQEITTNDEIKEEETWDISANQDGSVMAKWTRKDRSIVISGNGKMKDWTHGITEKPTGDWHDNQYTQLIQKVIIEEGVTSIGNYAFYKCSSLENISVESNNKYFSSENGVLFNKEKTKIICYPAGKKDLTQYNIPEGVTSIELYAFDGCSSLTSISIPEGVKSIANYAFYRCSSLTNINIPKGVTGIRSYTFYGCSSLTSINIPEGVTLIGEHAFDGCSSLTSINIPEQVTNIGWRAFSGCSSLTSINIPKGVTSIGNSTFWGCSSLTSITIPEGVTSIEDGAFYGCSSLTSINIPEGVTSIGEDAFYECSSLKNITIPEGVTSIGRDAFSECSSLKNITIPEGVTSIENYTFDGCSSLKNITIPEGVTSIGRDAFSECSSLTSITIPEGVTSIENYTFDGCSSLKNMIIPEGITSIGDNAFRRCNSLTSITIPEGVKNIGSEAFERCSSLTSITIPEGVTRIGNRAFDGCSSLTSINIPEGVTGIEKNIISKTTIIYTKSNTEGHRYAEEGKQGYVIDDQGPEITFERNGNNNPSKKQGTKVIVIDEESGLDEDTLKYKWIQSKIKPTEEEFIESFSKEETIEKNEGDGTWYLWILAKDKLGNATIERSEGFILDNTAPTAEVNYSITEPTNQNVTATITADEKLQELEGWSLSENKLTLTKEYTENTTEEIIVKDIAGNETKININITNIDKQAPLIEINYSTIEPTNQNVTVTIRANEQIQEVEGWTLSEDKLTLTKEYNENTTEIVIVKDLLGNGTQVKIEINNINKIPDNPEEKVKKGDINQDGKIDTTDLLKMLRHIATSKDNQTAQKYPKWILVENNFKAADINNDGKIDTTDTLKLLRHMAASKSEEIVSKYPDWIIQ